MLRAVFLRACLTVACATGSLAAHSWAQLNLDQPEETRGVEVQERLDGRLPAGLRFTDSTGRELKLEELVVGGLPTILTFNYSDCPMLCSMQLNGLVDSMTESGLKLGEEFRVVTIGLDPFESTTRAAETRARYVQELGVSLEDADWHFLLGAEDQVRAAADAAGFGYKRVEDTGEYVHAAVQIVLTPGGRISRYLYGVDVPARDLRMALVEASAGRIGTTVDAILLFCFHYDPGTGGYTFAWTSLRIGGVLTLLALGAGIYRLAHTRRAQAAERAFA
ncbi:MAG: SCO family protein [Planctomycetes bacterium]|nr:SCO family protein [Planctomycetota bacterium]MCB9903903.1 SCO family protein [Planctomycetota bacterium]